eukprot:14181814-Alexandrium_andersonii.AAC.1
MPAPPTQLPARIACQWGDWAGSGCAPPAVCPQRLFGQSNGCRVRASSALAGSARSGLEQRLRLSFTVPARQVGASAPS